MTSWNNSEGGGLDAALDSTLAYSNCFFRLLSKISHVLILLKYLVSRQSNRKGLLRQLVRKLNSSGFRGLRQAFFQFVNATALYAQWVKRFDTLNAEDKVAIRKHISTMDYSPLISVIMPVYDPEEEWLRKSIESVRRQLYPNWELCIADDYSTKPYVRRILEDYAKADSRINVVFRSSNGHIAAASNSALGLAKGEFIALLDHDDELAEHALYMVSAVLDQSPHLDLIYSDEDKIDALGNRSHPHFKPDWNPDLLLSQNSISHLGVYRTGLVRELGGFREGVEGCQDWDLALRVAEKTIPEKIFHVPSVLYHWRSAEGSTAISHEAKLYVKKAALKVVEDCLARKALKSEVVPAQGSFVRVRYLLDGPPPKVSIIIPTRNGLSLLKQCVQSILSRTEYPDYELLIVDNQSTDYATVKYLQEINSCSNIAVLHYDAPFNFSAIINFAVEHASGELICLLNNDTEVISADWLNELSSHAIRPEIGAVGAMLYYPDDTIQHAGVILGLGGVAGHWYSQAPRGVTGYVGRAALIQNFSAVTAACMVMRRTVFEDVGGMDEANLSVAYNDIDLCLRIREAGFRIVWTPYAELYHHESASRGKDNTPEKSARFERESSYMKNRWSQLERDPAYNPNLTLHASWPYLAGSGPRATKPWERFLKRCDQ